MSEGVNQMNKGLSKITLVKSRFTNKWYLKDFRNRRLTPKFILRGEKHVGQFVELDTDKGTIIYNKCCEKILYQDK